MNFSPDYRIMNGVKFNSGNCLLEVDLFISKYKLFHFMVVYELH